MLLIKLKKKHTHTYIYIYLVNTLWEGGWDWLVTYPKDKIFDYVKSAESDVLWYDTDVYVNWE